jgi:hypothetical protein
MGGKGAMAMFDHSAAGVAQFGAGVEPPRKSPPAAMAA